MVLLYRRYVVIWNNSKNHTSCSTSTCRCVKDCAISKTFWTLRHCAWAVWKPECLFKCPQPLLLPVVIFFYMHFTEEKCWTSRPLVHPLSSWPGAKQVNYCDVYLVKYIGKDSAKMESLSLYGLLEHFNVQIREWKSHPKIPKVYELWRHIHQRVNGFILPAHNRGKMDPQFITL